MKRSVVTTILSLFLNPAARIAAHRSILKFRQRAVTVKPTQAMATCLLVLSGLQQGAQGLAGEFAEPRLQFALAPANDSSEGASADEERAKEAELAKELQNPVAKLISVPIQNNWDFGIGPAEAMRYTVNVQPVIPFSISQDWNLITRTILPVIYAESPVKGGRDVWGLGDVVQSFFFSPKAPASSGWIWGAGPVLLYPTATDSVLGAGKWGAGPTAVMLKQQSGFTYGLLANHVWSYAGWGSQSVSATFLQPFLSYTTKTFTTLGVTAESTYNWNAHQWTVPVTPSVSQLLKIGNQPIQFSLGVKYFADKPSGGPDWGFRFTVTLLFPK